MDFSSAQLAAHSHEYATLLMKLLPGARQLSQPAYDAQYAFFLKEANQSQMGCQVHFFRSGTRLKQNGALIPRDLRGHFDDLLHIMVSSSTTLDVFRATVKEIEERFSMIGGWLEWWLRPSIASMIFPICRKVDPEVAKKVPSSSNPIEAQHSHLHSAVGTGHDDVIGVRKLFLYVRDREKHYLAIMGKSFFFKGLQVF